MLFLQPTLTHNSITTCRSHYYPRHVSGLDVPILRRNNCTNTASGILALELRIAHLIPERGYQMLCLCSCSSWGWARQGPKHVEDSNVTCMLLLNCALKLVEEIILYYDARSKKHQIVFKIVRTVPGLCSGKRLDVLSVQKASSSTLKWTTN